MQYHKELSRTKKKPFAFVYVNRVINTVKKREDNVARLDAILLNEDLITLLFVIRASLFHSVLFSTQKIYKQKRNEQNKEIKL